MAVNKKEFADRMAKKGGIKKKDAMKGLELFIETLMDCMSEHEKVKISMFGSFEMKTAKERIGRNPKTRKDMPYLFVKSWLPNTKINGTGTRSAGNSANHVFYFSSYPA